MKKKIGERVGNSILVIGDSIIDHDVYCEATGLSLETPTLKTRLVEEKYLYGGAANVVEHLLALDTPVTFITGVGSDEFTSVLLDFGTHKSLDLRPISYHGANLVKSRYWVKRGTDRYKTLQINRGDKMNNHDILHTVKKLLSATHHMWTGFPINKAVLVDYGNGMFSDINKTQRLVKLLKSNGIEVISSCQKSDRETFFSGLTESDLICMNKYESEAYTKALGADHISILSRRLSVDICVTDGDKGSTYYSNGETKEYSSVKVECVDSCGAGDAFLAALVASGDVSMANKWAALSVTKQGTEVPKMEELDEL